MKQGKWFTNGRKSKKMLPGSCSWKTLPEIDLSCTCSQGASPLRHAVIHQRDDRPQSLSTACWQAWLICRLKTAIMALSICTIFLVLNLFAIIAAACLIITKGVVMLSDMPLEIPFPQLRTSMEMQQRCWARKQLYLRQLSSCT